MKSRLFLLLCFGLFMCFTSKGQSTRDVSSSSNQPPAVYQNQSKDKRDKIIGKWFRNRQKSADQVYEKTVKSAVKARKKADRLAQKPQFSDPSYFGHKKPPIRRPPGKQKYCKECELRH